VFDSVEEICEVSCGVRCADLSHEYQIIRYAPSLRIDTVDTSTTGDVTAVNGRSRNDREWLSVAVIGH
jgi:hypothetical protein